MHPPTARFYYGWIIVALSFVNMFFVMGTFFSSGVLLAAMSAEYGWSRATISLPFSIALIGYAGTAWLAGRLFDRYGPRRVFAAGVLCLGVGLLTSAQARNPFHLCLTWGILVGQGMNFAGFAPHIALIALWFRRQRGIAIGIAIGGASLGGVLIKSSSRLGRSKPDSGGEPTNSKLTPPLGSSTCPVDPVVPAGCCAAASAGAATATAT